MSEGWVMALLPICLRLLCFSWAVLERMKEMAFFFLRVGEWLILSGATHTMRHFTIFLMCAHNCVRGLQNECYQERSTAAKGWSGYGLKKKICDFSCSVVEAIRRWTINSTFIERDNGLFTETGGDPVYLKKLNHGDQGGSRLFCILEAYPYTNSSRAV